MLAPRGAEQQGSETNFEREIAWHGVACERPAKSVADAAKQWSQTPLQANSAPEVFTMSNVFTIHFEEPDFTIATCDNALVWCYRGPPTVTRMQRSLPVHRDLQRRFPKGFGVITIVGENMPVNSPPEVRKEAEAITAEFRDHYCALVDVIEITGLKGAAIRGAMAGIRLFARPKCPAKITQTIAEGSAWIAPQIKASQADLLAACQRVRSFPGVKAAGVSASIG